ncbi:MAG: S1C family serine protease [Phycisphaerales bacterium]
MRTLTILGAILACSLPAPAIAQDAMGIDAPARQTDLVTFTDGRVVSAPIVKETADAVWLDLGYDVLKIPRTSIETIERAAEQDEIDERPGDRQRLYRVATGNAPERSPKEHSERVGGAVVLISTPRALGSGFIINPEGYAITNAHVIQGEKRLRATVFQKDDGAMRRMDVEDVEIIAVNNHLDLALIKLEHPDGGEFPTVPLNLDDDLSAGQSVFAIGAPLGLERTLSEGVVATTLRNFEGVTYIQTTAQINPGNSGGPLFNAKGEVIGVANMKIPFGEGLGFAIPMRYVRDFIRHRDAFAYDKNNPNSGYLYNDPAPRVNFGEAPALDDSDR